MCRLSAILAGCALPLLLATSAPADPCVDYMQHLRVSVDDRSLGDVFAVAIAGDVLYLALEDGLATFDLTDPLAPARIATAPYSLGRPTELCLHGALACLTHDDTGGAGLSVFDVSDPASPTLLGALPMTESAWDVETSGDHAFVANGADGMCIVDVSDPTQPTVVASTPPSGEARGVSLFGDLVLVAEDKLRAYDISDPLQPWSAGEFSQPATGIRYTAAGHDGDRSRIVVGRWSTIDPTSPKPKIQVVDMTDPDAMTLIGDVACPGNAQHIVVDGDLAFVSFTTPGSDTNDQECGLQILDLADPAHPADLGALGLDYDRGSGVVRHGDVLYVASMSGSPSRPGSLQIVELSSLPGAPATTRTLDYLWNQHVATAGDVLALASREAYGVVRFVNASDPTSPFLSEIELGLPAPTALEMPSPTLALCATGVVSSFTGDVLFLDTTDPASPFIRSSVELPIQAAALTMDGSRVYGIGWQNLYEPPYPTALSIVDASDLDHPQLVGQTDGVYGPKGITVDDGVAYVSASFALGYPNLVLYDVSDPTAPALVREMDFGGGSRDGIVIRGDVGFLLFNSPYVDPDHTSFLLSLSLADPTDPVEIDRLPLPGELADGLVSHDDFLYVSNYGAGTLVIDASDPADLRILGGTYVGGSARTVATNGESLFTILYELPTHWLPDLLVSPMQCGAAVSAPVLAATPDLGLRAYPNPFVESTTIEFALDRPTTAELAVFDVRGRRVAQLANGVRPAGSNSVTWDGRTRDGQPAAAGVYWLVLTRDGETRVRKALRLR